jgi:SAM-dependent methyltransferase
VPSAFGRAGDRGSLAHYDDPAYYEKTYSSRRHDVDYYVRLARRTGGPVLEYGVGNGRVALPIARAGLELVGVDIARPMLKSFSERLRREPADVRARVRLVRGDMRHVRLKRRFRLVIAPFNTLLHLYTLAEIEAFLARVREHLAPGGRFVFDFSMPQPQDLVKDPSRSYRAPRLRHPTARKLVDYGERFAYDPVRQILLVEIEFSPEDGSEPWCVPLTHRQFFPQEMAALLHYNGFSDLQFSADFRDRPPEPPIDSLIVSCRPARPKGGGRK